MLANDGPVRQRLESVASEVSKAVDKELQASPGGRSPVLTKALSRGQRSAQGDYCGQEGSAEDHLHARCPKALSENWAWMFVASFSLSP